MTVAIGLGNRREFRIAQDNRLKVVSFDTQGRDLQIIDLGPATIERLEELRSYLERLKVHGT